MFKLDSLSIKWRLLLIILLVSMVSVLLMTIATLTYGIFNMRENVRQEVENTAAVVAERNRFALKMGNREDVSNNLQTSHFNKSIERICVYDTNGELFAFYPFTADEYSSLDQSMVNRDLTIKEMSARQAIIKKNCPPPTNAYSEFINGKLESMHPIMLNNEHVGDVFLLSNTNQIYVFIRQQLQVMISIFFCTFMVAYLLAIKMQRSISEPILMLSKVARYMSLHKDYSMRAPLPEENGEKYTASMEIRTLIESFNNMLGEMNEREESLHRKNIELERAREQAESANLTKTKFLASISHELRTPLNAIIGFSSIIKSQLFGELNEKYMEYAHDIHESGVHLLEIINDILDLSKAEAGKLILDFEEFDISKAIWKSANILQGRAEWGAVELLIDIPKSTPYIIADRVRFIQIMLNLMSNAIKFTETGGKVRVSVQHQIIGEKRVHFRIDIADTGIGMTNHDITQAMQSFGQVDNTLSRKYEGTGLGIPLSKKLVELHKGSMEIESELGVGTIVHLQFISDPVLLKYRPST